LGFGTKMMWLMLVVYWVVPCQGHCPTVVLFMYTTGGIDYYTISTSFANLSKKLK
jgi:hypothetical protein